MHNIKYWYKLVHDLAPSIGKHIYEWETILVLILVFLQYQLHEKVNYYYKKIRSINK
jgi:hypothetical protein